MVLLPWLASRQALLSCYFFFLNFVINFSFFYLTFYSWSFSSFFPAFPASPAFPGARPYFSSFFPHWSFPYPLRNIRFPVCCRPCEFSYLFLFSLLYFFSLCLDIYGPVIRIRQGGHRLRRKPQLFQPHFLLFPLFFFLFYGLFLFFFLL